MTTEGRKDDAEKTRLDLIPPEFVNALGEVLTYGATKYEPRNWEKGMAWGRVFAALMRHLWAWWRGEIRDYETGMPHLWHATACLCFLVSYEMRGMTQFDDRPNSPEKELRW